MFDNKTLLITGGTGSFGNKLLEMFLNSNLKEIRIFSRDEKKQDDMRKKYNHPKIKYYIGDVRDKSSLEVVMHSNMKGIYHAVNDTKISKYKLLKLFSKYFKKLEIIKNDEVVSDKSLIKSRDYYPYKILDYEDMIKEMKDWSERK